MQKRTFNVKLLDGSYELYFDNAALYEFESVHGKQPMAVIGSGEMGPRAATHFVYAGLLHGDDRMSLQQVIPIIPTKKNDFFFLVETIIKAVQDAYDLGKDAPKKKTVKNAAAPKGEPDQKE